MRLRIPPHWVSISTPISAHKNEPFWMSNGISGVTSKMVTSPGNEGEVDPAAVG